MGLGEAARAGAIVFAILVYSAAAVLLVAVGLVLRWRRGHWRPALVLWGIAATAAVVVVGAAWLHPDARARRHAEAVRDEAAAAAGVQLGNGFVLDASRRACGGGSGAGGTAASGGGRGADAWVAQGAARTDRPAATADAFATGLRDLGYTVDRGTSSEPTGPAPWVLGTAGDRSVRVEIADHGALWLSAEDGCVTLGP